MQKNWEVGDTVSYRMGSVTVEQKYNLFLTKYETHRLRIKNLKSGFYRLQSILLVRLKQKILASNLHIIRQKD